MSVTDKALRVVARDGSRKYVFPLEAGRGMEAAFFEVPGRDRPLIACVSTQVGCAVGCPFCATAREGFFRNLTTDEVLLQISTLLDECVSDPLALSGVEVSFMGMGEPLANRKNVLSAIEATHARYPQVSRVSVSTAGPSVRIDALTACMPAAVAIHLQISLHATLDSVRRRLIPQAPDSIENLMAAGRRYHIATGDKVCLNYIPLRGINSSPEDAAWLSGIDPDAFYVKLTALNPTPGIPETLTPLTPAEMWQFGEPLRARGVSVKVFLGDGLDVQASCGQLAATPVELRVSDATVALAQGG